MGWAKEQLIRDMERGFDDPGDKYVCEDCFGNYAIKKYIINNSCEYSCTYCRKESDTYPISVPLEDAIEIILEGIQSEWDDPVNCVGWDSSEGGWLGVTIYDKYELFDELYQELDILHDDLREDILDCMNDNEWCQADPYGDRRNEEQFYKWRYFCNQVKHKIRYVFFKNIDNQRKGNLYDLSREPFEIMYDIGKTVSELGLIRKFAINSCFYRGRMHNSNQCYKTLEDLRPPDLAHSIYANRMSPAGISMFYGALDKKTVLEEIKDNKREYVSIGVFKNLIPLNIIDLTELPRIPSLFDSERRQLRSDLFFLMDFIKDLSKPISKDGREHIEYVPTQIITEYFRYMFKTSQGEKINGIIYPSSRNIGGKSCVLFFDYEDCTVDSNIDEEKKLCLVTSENLTGHVDMFDL